MNDLEIKNKIIGSLNNIIFKIDKLRNEKMTIKEFNKDSRAIDFDSGLGEAKIMICEEIDRVENSTYN